MPSCHRRFAVQMDWIALTHYALLTTSPYSTKEGKNIGRLDSICSLSVMLRCSNCRRKEKIEE